MDEFLILLQAKLDEAKSIANLNGTSGDIAKLQGKLEALKLQVTLDPNAAQKLANDIGKLINQKITISNINIDSNQAVKNAQQSGKQIGNALNESVASSIGSIKKNITDTLKGVSNLNANDIIKNLNLNRSSVGSDVVGQVRLLVSEVNNLGREAARTNSDSAWEQLISKCTELGKVLDTFGKTRSFPGMEEIKKFADYFNGKTISVGYKSSGLSGTDLSTGTLNRELKDLGVQFSATKQEAISLDTVWEEMCNSTGRMDLLNITTAQDQLQTIISELQKAQSILNGEQGLIPHPNAHSDVTKYMSDVERARDTVINLQNEMSALTQKESQESTTSTDVIIKNESRKQQAIQQTANVQRQITENESLIKSSANVITFEHTNNAAREASKYFKELLQDENAVISVSEHFGELNGLTSFTVNVKRATGEVESLRYALKEIKDSNGNGTGEFYFVNKGAELNNSYSIKQIQAVENAFADYTAKLAQFKSTNSEILSGLSVPITDFENKLLGLKNGTSTINEVTNSFKSLNTEASNITANFSKQLSPIDSAIRNITKGEETIAGLRAEIKGLNNAPKEINTELNKCSSLLTKVKQIESENGRTSEWSQAYKEWANSVDTLKAKLTTLRKEQANTASTQIFKIGDLKNNDIAYMSKVYNTIEKQMSEINKMANAKGWNIVDVSGVEQADGKIKQLTLTVEDAEGALKRLNMQREKLQGNGKAQYGLMQVGDVKVIETASQAQEKLAQNAEKANAKLAEQVNKIQLSIGDKGDVTTQIKTLSDNFTKLGLSADEVKSKMNGVDTELTELKSLLNSGANNFAIITQFDKMQSVLKETQNDLKTTRSEYSLLVSTQQRLNKANTIEAWKQKNTAITKQAQADTQAYIDTLRNLNVQMTKMEFDQISRGFKETEISMRGINKLGASFKEQMSQATQSFTQWLSVSSAVMLVISKTRNAISELKEINTLLTEISKANDKLSKSDLDNIGNNSFDIASKYGKNATDYLSGVQEASRAGYENAEGIAELSVAAQGAGDMTAELANQYLIATDKAYKFGGSVEKLTEVLDGSNYITNHNAVNMTELAESMSIVGSTAASFGVDVDETTAALGTMIATTQQSGSEVARAFKAILLNIRQVSDEEEGIDAEGLTKYENACNALNVKLKETKNGVLSLRDPMEVLRDLSIEYNKLEESDIRRTELLSSVGGKLRATQLDALLRQWDTYETMLQQYANGTGSMAVEAEKTANSWEGSMNRLGNTWKDTIENIADSDAIITVINSLNSLLSVVNNVTDKLGSLGTIGLGAGIFAGAKNTGKCRMSVRIS